jgi:endoplasmic reticulum resident protein 44
VGNCIGNDETMGRKKIWLSQNLHSFHREFHYGPEDKVLEIGGSNNEIVKKKTTPPESTFKKLAPSKNRYTLLKDEL